MELIPDDLPAPVFELLEMQTEVDVPVESTAVLCFLKGPAQGEKPESHGAALEALFRSAVET
ncbi:hypothetical protein [Paracoccus ravus]|uniref:hypothetical protein n=1 Tax=Paracoccus ravus TaxID=2447760 RepID=UPI00106E35B9|nr:hypothetical protein [Paracoccus ravus]